MSKLVNVDAVIDEIERHKQYMRDKMPNEKLEEITWKDDSLWYLTRPMKEDEEAETHTFRQDSEWGVFEGTVTIIERKE